jgi:hypothetical protein
VNRSRVSVQFGRKSQSHASAGLEVCDLLIGSLISEASDIQAKALAKGHYSAAISALAVKAKLSGHWLDRAENKTNNVVYHISDRPMTQEEWAEKWCK